MATSTMNTKNITFTREQKNFLDEFFATKATEYKEKILDDDNEEMTPEALEEMAKAIFNTKGFKVSKDVEKGGKKPRKTKAKKVDGPKRPINAYMRWLNTEGRTYIKEELEITDNKEIVKKAGEIWAQHKEENDDVFTKYDTMYKEEMIEYKKQTEGAEKSKTKKEKAQTDDEASDDEGSANGEEQAKKSSKKPKTYDLGKFTKYDDLDTFPNKYMRGSFTKENKGNKFDSLEDAYEAMEDDDEAVSIFLNKDGEYTLRKSCKMSEGTKTQVPCLVWVKKDPDSESDSD